MLNLKLSIMKKKLLSLFALGALGVFTNIGYSQVNITEDFDAGLGGFTGSFDTSGSNDCGTGSARENLYGSVPNGELISPTASATGGDINISFDYKVVNWNSNTPTTGNWGTLILEHTTDGGGSWIQDTLIDQNNHSPSGTCVTVSTVTTGVEVPNGSTVQWRIAGTRLAGDWDVYIDNFSIVEVVSCAQPTALTASNITPTSVDLGWTDNTGGGASQWDIEIGLAGFTPSGTPQYSGVTNPYNVSPLTPGTSYEYYVRADCGGGDLSGWSGPFAFSTPQIPVTVFPYMQDWETGQGNWQTANGGQENQWHVGTATNNGGTQALYVSNDNGATHFYDNSITSVSHAFRDFQVAPGNPFIQLSFDWLGEGEAGAWDKMRVYVAPTTFTPAAGTTITAAGVAPTGIIQLGGNFDSQSTYTTETFTLDPSYSGTDFRIIFEWSNDGLFGSTIPAAVDNVNMQVASCAPITNLTASNITTTDADIDWTETGSEISWNIQYGPAGFGIGTGTTWGVSVASDTTFDNLTQNTDYDVYVQAVCGTNDTSIWVGPLNFTTDAVCPAPTAFQTTYIAEDTIAFDWTNGGTETAWILEYGPAGFTPGTGTTVPFTSNPDTLFTVPNGDVYEFILYADCGTMQNDPFDGPISIGIPDPNIGFLDWDSTCTTPFEDISGTGQALGATIGDDGATGITLPFAFQLDDEISNEISVGNNGGVVFGTLFGGVGITNNPIASLGDNGFYPYWDDLGTTGNVYYEVLGTAPNRRAIVQWNRARFGGADQGNLQLVMYEGTHEFRFVYDDVDFGDPANDFGAGATVGTKTNNNDAQVSFNDPVINNGKCISWYYETCPMVTDVNVTNVNTDSVFFTITPRGNETEWKIEYGPAGFTPGTGMSFIGNSLIDTIPGLDQFTEYDFYVYAACGAGDTSMAFGPVNFTTDPVCPAPTNFQAGYVTSDTLELEWLNGGTETMWNVEYGPVGFTPGTGTTVAFNTNPDTLFGLPDGMVYDFIIYSDCGSPTNNPFAGPVTVATPIVNDSTCFAVDLDYDSTYTFSNSGATIHPMETRGNGANALATVWFRFVSPASGKVGFDLSGSMIDTYTSIYSTSDCGDWSQFVVEGDSDPNTFELCGLSPSTVYYIQVDGFQAFDQGLFNIRLTDLEVEAGTPVATLICGGTTHDLNTSVSGADSIGTWTEINPVIGLVSGSDYNSSSFQAAGIYELEYRVSNVCGYDSVIVPIEIFQNPSAGMDGTISQECNFGTVNLFDGLTGTVDLGGTWYDDQNNPVSGNSVDFNGEAAGQYVYTYIASNGVCTNDSSTVTIDLIDCTSLTENDLDNFVSLYPNPTSGIVFINNHGIDDDFTIEVSDMNGKVMKTIQIGMNKGEVYELDMNTNVKGIYFVRIKTSTGIGQHKVVVQ